MPRHFATLLLIATAACAPTTEWERASTSLSQRQSDEKACLDLAQYQAFDESDKSKPIYPPFKDTQFTTDGGGDDGGGGGLTTSYARRGARVYELSEYCMQQRGYYLVPIAKK
jgi:hypothetical protein